MWKNQFQQLLYNSVKCDDDASLVKQLLPTVNDNPIIVCMSELINAINKQKNW